MQAQEELIRFKTDAWKGTGMVANYAQRMHDNRGTNRLKNAVEVALCRENVTGREILDVGIGTGRGSLPLAREGYRVTGVDVSQAMLDQCRREAGETPIELVQGDITALPFADDSFDSLISLNVAVHFPNWRDALKDWARVVRPGGRIVFDVHSQDHLDAVASARNCGALDLLTPGQRTDPSQFMLRIRAEDVVEAATECGLSVERLVPYAALLGGGNINYWLLDSRLWGYLGDRVLSWMAVDEKLFDFGLFIEREIVAALSTCATGRFMIVLEKRPDAGKNRGLLQAQKRVNSIFDPRTSGDALQAALGSRLQEWKTKLHAHLAHAQNAALLAMALSGPQAQALRPLLGEFVGEAMAETLFDAHSRQRVDEEVHAFVNTWYETAAAKDAMHYKGIDLGPVFSYDLMDDVLRAEYFDTKGC